MILYISIGFILINVIGIGFALFSEREDNGEFSL